MKSSPFAIPREQFLSPTFLTWSKHDHIDTFGQRRRHTFLLGRHALYHGLRALGIVSGDEVLVPSYICAAAVEAIRAYGALPLFFRVGRDCSLDYEDIQKRISSRTRALLIVHYFGFPQDLQRARDVAARHNLLLIEDCAHILQADAQKNSTGRTGHASVFSWRKFLPTLYGAELVLNFGAPLKQAELTRQPFGFELRTIKSMLDTWSVDRRGHLARFLLELPAGFLRLLRKPSSYAEPRNAREDLAVQSKSGSFEPALAYSALCRVSHMIFRHSDIAAVAAKRRHNYKGLAERLAAIPGVCLLFPALPENGCPLHLPLVLRGSSGVHRQLRQLGIPATAWDGVRPSGVSDDCFPDAAFLYENLIFLPVHQSLDDRDLDVTSDAVSEVARKHTEASRTAFSGKPNPRGATDGLAGNRSAGSFSKEQNERKKVLLVAYHFPPQMGSSGLLRSLKYCRYLPQHGWQPTILTAHPRAYERLDSSQLDEIPATVKVIRAFALDTQKHLSLRGRYLRSTALPDRWVTWSLGATVAGIAQIRTDNPDVIFTTFPIATAVLIGYLLHRMTGVSWVADFRDSMTEDGYPTEPHMWKAFRWLEKKAVRHASRLIFTARSTREMYLQRYPELPPERCLVISNGYDEEDFSKLAARDGRQGTRLRICHSGVIYPEERDPGPFFQALSRLKNDKLIDSGGLSIDLRACGHEATFREIVTRLKIEDLVHFLPPLPYHGALQDCNSADVLLLMQAACCDHQIPAKAYEYLRLGKPILALTSRTGDTAALLQECGGATIMDIADQDAIYRALPEFLRAVRAREHQLPDRDVVSRYSRQNQAGQLALCLSELMESRARQCYDGIRVRT